MAEDAYNETKKAEFDAEQEYRAVKADYDALVAVSDGKVYAYVGAPEGTIVDGHVVDAEGFIELSVNEEINNIEGSVELLYKVANGLIGAAGGDITAVNGAIDALHNYNLEGTSTFELTLAKKVLLKAKEYGKVTVDIVLEMLDDQIKYIDEQIDIWTVIANKYKVAMYAYLGIDEEGAAAEEE